MRNIFNLEILALLSVVTNIIPGSSALPAVTENDVLGQERRGSEAKASEAQLPIYEHSHQRIYKNDEDTPESIAETIRIEMTRREVEERALGGKREVPRPTRIAVPNARVDKRAARSVYFLSTYAADATTATAIHTPSVLSTSVLGGNGHSPTSKFVYLKGGALPTLAASDLTRNIDPSLQNDYPSWNGSGYVAITSVTSPYIKTLNTKPSYSRDQCKGGTIGSTSVFVFADTQCYTAPNSTTYGSYTGSISNSAAMDLGAAPKSGNPVVLSEGVGAFSTTNGFLRSFIPYTTAEQEYNNIMFNEYGSRYAIWPESSFVPLTSTSSLLFAPIVYQNSSSSGTTYTYSGTTMSTVTISASGGGPIAERTVPLLFPGGGIEWGCIGGLRSYGSSGTTGGNIYLFGNMKGGIGLARTSVANVGNLNSYQYYWPGHGWNSTAPTSSSNAYFVSGGYSTVDVFYSPRHLTFIMVFMDIYIDNKIYWSYLKATKPIVPTYAGGDDEDIGQYLPMYSWSSWILLMNLPTPGQYYTYGGGMHGGYFGQNDITRGGNKMLLTWTAPTGKNGASLATGYSMMSATATWS